MKGQDQVAGVAVRLVCRYSNGLVKSFIARGVSFEEDILKVACSESFEPGIGLTVMAPFLSGMQPGRVMAVGRAELAGSFLLEVKLRPAPSVAVKPRPTAPERDTLGRWAVDLAGRLEGAGALPLYPAAFERATAGEQPGFLKALAAAIVLLLEEKQHVDGLALLTTLRKPRDERQTPPQ